MTTIREMQERRIVLRSLREGIDTSNAAGRMVAGVVATSLSWNSNWEKRDATASREARRARGQSIGRLLALDPAKIALAQRINGSGESANSIATTLAVCRATIYRALA
ncbi:recombinase family protein [Mycolicibacterium komossense]|uniref:recombinase family protein n=1 Tax=Mycolicibacterium komossense TaxID=1779 RepID=UPI00338DDD14